MYLYRAILLVVLLCGPLLYGQVSNKDVKAKILTEEVEGMVKVTGSAENLSDIVQSLSYKLTVIKENMANGNKSNNVQEGIFTLQPGEIKNLSVTQVNYDKTDQVIIMLLFFDAANVIIGKDRIVLGDKKKIETEKPVTEEGFVMTGIVTDDTKTKAGKDFYDLFYYIYNEKKINSNKIITVSEELSFARNTKIVISIENVIVSEFLTKPDEEFLTQMADYTVNATGVYLKNLERQAKDITRY